MYIIIDSSHGLLYTGIVSGRRDAIFNFCHNFEKDYRKEGLNTSNHWKDQTKKEKAILKSLLPDLLNKSPNVHLNVLQHRKPGGVPGKKFYFQHLPGRIVQRLENGLLHSNEPVELIVDDDYRITNNPEGTKRFVENILMQASHRITGEIATIRREEKMKMTIKKPDGNLLNFYASVAEKENNFVKVVDAYLGLYLLERNAFKDMKNAHHP